MQITAIGIGAEQGSVDRCTREVSIDDAAPQR